MDEERYGGWSRGRFTGQDVAELEALLTENPTERHNLEYKGPGWSSPKNQKSSWKHELAWQVASLANSAGGLLVWGVDEHRDDPGSGPTVGPTEERFDGQRLSDILNTGVEPALDYRDFEVIPYQVQDDGFVYVIYVPQSARAPHMVVSEARNGEHHGRYPKRSCEGPQVMLDYEVRDVMGRRQRPDLHLGIGRVTEPRKTDTEVFTANVLFFLANRGRATARDVMVELNCAPSRVVRIAGDHPRWVRRDSPGHGESVCQKVESPVLVGFDEHLPTRWTIAAVARATRCDIAATIYADGLEPSRQYFRWNLPLGYANAPEDCDFKELLGDDAKDAARHFEIRD